MGLRPVTLSTDDYFVNREDTPRAFDGSYDFESLRAIDVDLFNRDLACLVEGGEVLAPTFDFRRGLRMDHVRPLQVEPGHPILVEGIHALNEALTPAVGRAMKFKIYISSMVQIDIDNYNRVSTSDARLLRRLVRDSQYRGRSAADTLIQWPSVRRGEEQNIFPYQEEADAVFNTALVYETGVFKKYAETLDRVFSPAFGVCGCSAAFGHAGLLPGDRRRDRTAELNPAGVYRRQFHSFGSGRKNGGKRGESIMKYAVIYSSETGNTARLAEVIRQELGEEECLYFGLPKEAPEEKLAQAEVLFVGFWTDKGNCNSETAEFLQSLAGRRIFLFGTAGFGGEERFLQNILENAGKKSSRFQSNPRLLYVPGPDVPGGAAAFPGAFAKKPGNGAD